MVTRVQVDRLPVLHRAKRVSKQTITGGFTYPIANLSFEDGTTTGWIGAGLTYTTEQTHDGHALKATHTVAAKSIYYSVSIIPDCLYQIKAGIYIPSGQNWTTKPKIYISPNTAKFQTLYAPTPNLTEDFWNIYDFQFSTVHQSFVDIVFAATESGAGPFDNYWYIDVLEIIQLEELR